MCILVGPVVAEAMFVNREEVPVYPVYRDPVSVIFVCVCVYVCFLITVMKIMFFPPKSLFFSFILYKIKDDHVYQCILYLFEVKVSIFMHRHTNRD